MKKMMVCGAFVAAVVSPFRVQAETVAYFPLDCDPVSGVSNLVSLVSPETYGLVPVRSASVIESVPGAVIGVPAALDGETLVDQPCNRTAVHVGAENGLCFQSEGLGAALSLQRDWTVEAWIRPTSGYAKGRIWYVLGTWNAGDDGFYLYKCAAGYMKIYAKQAGKEICPESVFAYPKIDWDSFSDSWHHFALVYECRKEEGRKGAFIAYLDGKNIGTNLLASAWADDGAVPSALYVGGCPNRTNFASSGSLDMVRVSDCARTQDSFLLPGRFRRYLSRPTHVRDIGYWRFEDGTVANCVNASNELVGVQVPTDVATTDVPIAEISNPDVEDGLSADVRANHAALSFKGSDGRFYLSDRRLTFSRELYLDRDFTIEAYWKFSEKETTLKYLYGVGSGGVGSGDPRWYIGTNGEEGTFQVYCKGASGVTYLNDVKFVSGGVKATPCWDGQWHHYALVYRANGGKGRFELFIDSVSKGIVELAAQLPKDVTEEFNSGLMVGGRGWAGHANAILDELRIVREALSPADFLCAPRREASPDVASRTTFAYWPLDDDSGSPVLRNAIDGGAPLTAVGATVSGDSRRFSSTVPRPDGTPGFEGDRSGNAGSVSLGLGSTLASYAASTVDLTATFTLEGWAMPQGSAPQVLASAFSDGYGWRFSVESERTVKIMVNNGTATSEAVFDVGSSLVGNWHHFALVHRGSFFWSAGTWRIYVDGSEVGTGAHPSTYPNDLVREPRPLAFGDGTDAQGKPLLLDTWRLVPGALASTEFLFRRGSLLLIR